MRLVCRTTGGSVEAGPVCVTANGADRGIVEAWRRRVRWVQGRARQRVGGARHIAVTTQLQVSGRPAMCLCISNTGASMRITSGSSKRNNKRLFAYVSARVL